MNHSRRQFLHRLGFAGLGTTLAVRPLWSRPRAVDAPAGPVIIATWNSKAAVRQAQEQLVREQRALDAIEHGIRVVESNPRDVTVGYGGLPDQNGDVTLDASIMDEWGNAGSVTYLQHIMHPISVARRIMEVTPHVMLSGEGAFDFAREQGFDRERLLTSDARRAYRRWRREKREDPEFVQPGTHDTVGMLALDARGDLSGGCSTSGWAYKMPGRVGDSPIIGAGLFVDNEIGAATATGLGELVMKTMSSFLIVEFMRQGMHPQTACEAAVRRIADKYPETVAKGHQVGVIALRKDGAVGYYGLQSGFQVTYGAGSEEPDLLISPHRQP